eukprot:scaffold14005_cov177-Isochrysis_galbana.AAC.1
MAKRAAAGGSAAAGRSVAEGAAAGGLAAEGAVAGGSAAEGVAAGRLAAEGAAAEGAAAEGGVADGSAAGSYSVLGMAHSVRGAIACTCTRLSLEAKRLSLGPPDLQLPAQLQWVNVLKLEGTII